MRFSQVTVTHYPRALTGVLVCLVLLLSACASVPTHKPIAPEVSIAQVKPLNFSLSGQKLLFTLRVRNNNNYDVPLKSLKFIASLAGEEIASGANNDRVTLPANGEAMVEVTVVAGLGTLADQLKSIASNDTQNIEYGLRGILRLSNWPAAIPFTYKGNAADAIQGKLTAQLNPYSG